MKRHLLDFTPSQQKDLLNFLHKEHPKYAFLIETTPPPHCWALTCIVQKDGRTIGETTFPEDVIKIIRAHENHESVIAKVKKKVAKTPLLRRRRNLFTKLMSA